MYLKQRQQAEEAKQMRERSQDPPREPVPGAAPNAAMHGAAMHGYGGPSGSAWPADGGRMHDGRGHDGRGPQAPVVMMQDYRAPAYAATAGHGAPAYGAQGYGAQGPATPPPLPHVRPVSGGMPAGMPGAAPAGTAGPGAAQRMGQVAPGYAGAGHSPDMAMPRVARPRTDEGRREKPRRRKQRDDTSPAALQARLEAAFAKRSFKGGWWCGPAIVAIWLMAAAYFFLMPPTYHSSWSLILPASNNGSTVALETIGQTTTSPTHPFGTVTLSPKAIYREVANSSQLIAAAAKSMDMAPRQFGRARVKLIDETSLMMFQISGRTPEQAQAKAKALMAAFDEQLDVLRRDEREKRAELVRDNLKIYKANLDKVREQITDFQRESGLLSISQYKEVSSSEELLRRKLGKQEADHQRLLAQQETLTARLNLSPELAAAGVRLASDASFGRLANVYSTSSATVHEGNFRYGPNHPALINARMKRKGALLELRKVAERLNLGPGVDLDQLMLMLNQSHQTELLKAIVAGESALAGSAQELESLRNELAFLAFKVVKLGKAASTLEALQKDHLVAEAVFTSAAARLDISRSDLFSSYPMVQVLTTPDLPESRSQPRARYAVAAGLLGTFLILLAWGATWVRGRFNQRR